MEEDLPHDKRRYGAVCELCADFIITDKDSPNYEGGRLFKKDHSIDNGRDTRRLIVCESCLDVEPCKATLAGVHPGPVVELDDDMASHYFDSNPFWHYLHQTVKDRTRTRYCLCPACYEVLYWSATRQRFVDLDVLYMGVTLDELVGKLDLDMVRVPMGTMAPDTTSPQEG